MKNYFEFTGNTVTIDYENLGDNIDILRRYNSKDLIVVAKNDGYNLGIEEVVKTCVKKGVKIFAVANLSEALRVKKLGLEVEVLVLNPIENEELSIAYENNLHLLVAYFEQVEAFNKFLKNTKVEGGLKFHLKVNCGMNRYGVTNEEIPKLLSLLKSNVSVKENTVGLMTHFPQSEEVDLSLHEVQLNRFIKAYQVLKDEIDFKYIHCENSAAFLLKDERLNFCNYGRVAIIAYGYKPIDHDLKLKPTMFLHNKIVNIRELKKGDYLGYGENKVSEDCRVAICPLGYGDGVIAERKSYPVFINGKMYDIIGNISMSHTYIKVDESVNIGDVVEVYGENIRFDDIKDVTNSRMMCSLKRM